MFYLCIKFHLHSFSASLIITVKNEYAVRAPAMFLFYVSNKFPEGKFHIYQTVFYLRPV